MQWTVVKSAMASRALVIFLIVLWRSFLSPYDTSATLNSLCIGSDVASPEIRVLWPQIASAIESSVVWDGVYFVRSSECGYEYEQSYAFLPLLPISIRILASSVFAPLVPMIGKRAVLAFSGYVINNVAFVLAALYFYKLSVAVLKDREAAFRASILFCFNPASIFYSSIYSESLYALLSVGGLYHLFSGRDKTGVVWLALSGAARSNGVINAGYICFEAMHRAANANTARRFVTVIVGAVVRCVCIFTPFLAFQAYGYVNMCVGSGDGARPWCKARIPLLYNYIQSHYWGVGFLRYFRVKQLPNFLLAAPILTLAFCAIFHYAKSDPTKFFSLGFRDENRGRKQKKNKTVKEGESWERKGELTVYMIPFVVHLAFLGATAFFVMHVQVATRFLSSSPPVYWFAAYLMGCRRWGYIIWAYSFAYILLGSLLFSNFYPFT